jgi:hypothetical protein
MKYGMVEGRQLSKAALKKLMDELNVFRPVGRKLFHFEIFHSDYNNICTDCFEKYVLDFDKPFVNKEFDVRCSKYGTMVGVGLLDMIPNSYIPKNELLHFNLYTRVRGTLGVLENCTSVQIKLIDGKIVFVEQHGTFLYHKERP